MAINPFDFVNAITWSKTDLISQDPELEKAYNAFMVNKALSFFSDTIFFTNEINKYHILDRKLQNDFYLNTITKGRRYSKWFRASEDDLITKVQIAYHLNQKTAKQYVDLLDKKQKKLLEQYLTRGIDNE